MTSRKRQRHLRSDVDAIARSLNQSWLELCARFLPEGSAGSKWRYSRKSDPRDLDQGWKLHLSATVLSANDILGRVAPFLRRTGVLFKAPSSLHELSRINSGLFYGYTQVGKFITVYPQSDQQAISLARRLHRLTVGTCAPAVPFDLEFEPGGCVYYRYGAFKKLELENPDGTYSGAVRSPAGELVPDSRETARPAWVSDPFISERSGEEAGSPESPLKTTVRAFKALSQRGKGGVYQAIDLSVDPPRVCILKEGRRGGETDWYGRDGNWKLRNEEQGLLHLRAHDIGTPAVYSSFEVEGNFYLVTEFIEGRSLKELLGARRKRLSVSQVLRYGLEVSLIISQISAAGWLWRDCKPSNLIVTSNGRLRPLDFEGACPIDEPDPLMWSSPGFSPAHRQDTPIESSTSDDVYSIGAIAYFMLTGRMLDAAGPVPITKLRRHVPSSVCDLISDLIADDPRRRGSAANAARRFSSILSAMNDHLPSVGKPGHRLSNGIPASLG